MQSSSSNRRVFPIAKYSCSSTRGHDQPDYVNAKASGSINWQEFAQSGISVTLSFINSTLTESASGSSSQNPLQRQSLSVQLQVIWTDVNQSLEYEKLDLNRFGTLHPHAADRGIKVVAKDNVVGFKYIAQHTNGQLIWRRFQMRFTNFSDARAFVHSIQDIVPCKSSTSTTASADSRSTTTTRAPLQLSTVSPKAYLPPPPSRLEPQSIPTHQTSTHNPTEPELISLLYASEARKGLTDDELESLIEEIVQEDGFVPFVHRVSKLWRARCATSSFP